MIYLDLMKSGGPVMWLILFCSVVATFIFIEKWFQFHRAQVNVGEMVNGLINVLRRDGMVEAITLCDNTPGPVARLLTAAIQAYQNDDDIKQAIDDAALVEVPRLESRLSILATIAYIAPLLGLLGTVVGMIGAFEAIQNKQGLYMAASDISLSGGIRMALVATAAGLCVAIPCHIAYNYLVSRVETFCLEMEKASSEILYFFRHHKSAARNGSEDAKDQQFDQDQD